MSDKIKKLTKQLLEHKQNSNNLLHIIASFESEDERTILACIRAVHKIFSHFLTTKSILLPTCSTDEELTNDEKYSSWLKERYDDTRSKLLQLLHHSHSTIQELSLCTLMKLIEGEGHHPIQKIPGSHVQLPVYFFEQVVGELLVAEHDSSDLLRRFEEYLEYDDVRYYAMKYVLRQLKQRDHDQEETGDLSNMFVLLETLHMPESPPDQDHLDKFLSIPPEKQGLKVNSYKEHKKLFTTVWLEFLKCKLSTKLYKKVLLCLHEKVVPHMTNPLLLADFLTDSYNIGGAISLLSLNGIFILVNKYNLDYPDFYEKLYSLFEPSLFHVKYSARFFYLADLFLTSSHLPSYLVAAFIKRLSRLLLTAPPAGATIIIPFMYNLIRRHPNCKVLLHRTDSDTEFEADPYVMEETDPAKCRALESSLWEIKTLQHHYHHSISAQARLAEKPLSEQETDISDLLDTTVTDLIAGEKKAKFGEIPTTFEPPKGLFDSKEDQLKQYWTWTE